MGKNPPRVCGICGKEETTGWTSHKQRKHREEVVELIIGEIPLEPKSADWFERLSPQMQLKYALSKQPTTKDITLISP